MKNKYEVYVWNKGETTSETCVGTFGSRREARDLAKKLKSEGKKVEIVQH